MSLFDSVGNHATHQLARTYGVVVAGDYVVDHVRVAVCVDQSNDRDAELVGFGNRNVLFLGVDHEDGVGRPAQPADSAKVALELLQLTPEHKRLFLGHSAICVSRLELGLDLVHLRDAGVDGREVREHPTQPALIHVRHMGPARVTLHRFLRLLLRAYEQNRSTISDQAAYEVEG